MARPAEPTFVGRAETLEELAKRQLSEPVVCLLGPGGVGKSRVAQEWAKHFADSLIIDLSETRSRAEVVRMVADVLNVPSATTAASVAAVLREKGDFALVLDNVPETKDGYELAKTWTAAAPQLRVVLTGRLDADMTAEVRLTVPPLSASDAALLFRRHATESGADLSKVDEQQLLDLLKPLGGLPLAIELLADRARLFRFEDLAKRIERALGPSPGGGLGGRLEQVLAFRWEVLDPEQRILLAVSSVFRGGFTLNDLEATLRNADVLRGSDVPGLVAELENTGLVLRTVVVGQAPRFAPLRVVASYIARHIDPDPSYADAHARCYASRGGAVPPIWVAPGEHLEDLRAEQANLRVATEYALGSEVEENLELALHASLGTLHWASLLGLDPAYSLIDRCLERSRDRKDLAYVRARLHLSAAMFAALRGEMESCHDHIERGHALADHVENQPLSGAVDLYQGSIFYMERSLGKALPLMEKGIAQLKSEGEYLRVVGMANLAMLQYELGHTEAARRMLGEARLDSRPWADRHAYVLQAWANERLQEGDFSAAREALEESVAIAAELGLNHVEARARLDLSSLLHMAGDLLAAERELREAERGSLRTGHLRNIPRIRGLLACVQLEQGEYGAARESAREAVAGSERAGASRTVVAFSAIRVGAAIAQGDREGAAIVLERLVASAAKTDDPIAHHLAAFTERWARRVRLRQAGALPLSETHDVSANVLLCRVTERALGATAIRLGFIASAGGADVQLTLESHGHRFYVDGVSRTCAAQNAARALVLLAKKRLNAPGEPVQTEELIAAIWPDEVLRGRSGPNRLHVALSKLRALGLKPHLRRKKTGYYLDPNLVLRIVPEGTLT